jgi:POT family proton-dependent oligopeptide transporter
VSANADTITGGAHVAQERHPKGLAVLFATEMWERFSFYSMLALFTLYLRDPKEGFGWTAAEATALYSNYLAFVYASPLIGGLIADKITGYRKAVMIGGFFFMAGHGLLSIQALWAVYLALTCLVIGNGFFKPNVSTMVGNLYPEGSHLKDRAYNIFYLGINVGAFLAPIVMEIVKAKINVHVAFAVAAFGMVISVSILWFFKQHVLQADRKIGGAESEADAAATATDAPPHGISDQRGGASPVASRGTLTAGLKAAPYVIAVALLALGLYFIPVFLPRTTMLYTVIGIIVSIGLATFGYSVSKDVIGAGDSEFDRNLAGATPTALSRVPDWKRAFGLVVIFAVVIVFWMVFHQNGSTLTYFADDNTDWNVTGTISNSINSFWILVLTFPLVWFWGFLDRRGREPSTPTKMAFGMTLTGLSFLVLWYGATIGENMTKTADMLAKGEFRINERVLTNLGNAGVPKDVLDKIQNAKAADGKNSIFGVKFSKKTDEATKVETSGEQQLISAVNATAPGAGDAHKDKILQNAYLFRVSPFWLIFAYMIVTLGELMLSPMGLSLVSKVAPISKRGLLMGGWFVATAIGNKLTQIGVFWDIWLQSTFFLVLACMALFMAVVLFLILKPLKKAMPGV